MAVDFFGHNTDEKQDEKQDDVFVFDEKETKTEPETELEKEKPVSKKDPSEVILVRYPEIEDKVKECIDRGDIDTLLMLNELTLARNLEAELTKKEANQFKVVFVAFKADGKVVKRAGVYNEKELPDPEDAEDIIISEDFTDNRVLAIPRNSVFAKKF